MKHGLIWSIFAITLLGCAAKEDSSTASSDRRSPTYAGPAEATFCSTSKTYADSVTISGTAQYLRREAWGNLTSGGLGSAKTSGVAHPATTHPIRQAEVRVLDASGAVIQCGSTDDSGSFSVLLPRGNTLYTVQINSRAYNNLVKVSVLNAPEQNAFYSLTKTVTANGSSSLGTITASADGDVLGGAFNIMDQIYNANLYLKSQVSSCATTFAGCKNVDGGTSTLTKVSAYWQKGYNPNNYFGSTSGLSFYLPGYSRLFILGGNDGLVDTVDTDHFDNSVIIHEYGHFLEDTVGDSDSPGGSHNGNKVIDPRLAWSEGWGNFFQAAVRNDNHYIDTIGNDDSGTTDMAFYTDIENASIGSDYPNYQGEGNYREFSVTRLLWDVVDNHDDNPLGHSDDVSGRFNEIWAAFSSSVRGFKYSGYAFRNIGLLHLIQAYFHATITSTPALTSDWSNLRLGERQDGDEALYGQAVSTSGCTVGSHTVNANSYYFQTTDNTVGFTSDSGSLANSNPFRNNLFFHFKPTTSGNHSVKLIYQDADGVAQEADLDLYVYKKDYHFATTADMLGYSRADASGVVATPESPEIVSANLSGGMDYLINVNVYTGSGSLGTQAYFNLYLDGSLLCPASLVP